MSSSRKNQNQKKIRYYNPQRRRRNRLYLAVGIIAVIAVIISVLFMFGSSLFSASPKHSNNPMIPSATATPSATSTSTPQATASLTPKTSPAGEYSASGTKVLLMTSMGNITVQMRDDKPITTANFVKLVKQGFYDGTIFHRVMAGFMIQGGENNTVNAASIADEIGNDNVNFNCTIAMANTGQPNSASSQFFINVADNQNLYPTFDTSYTVFGQVIQGMNVVMAISNVATNQSTNQPLQNVTLIKAEVMP